MSSSRSARAALVALLCSSLGALLGLPGCIAISYRVGAGPTVDTEGRPGGELFLGVTLGGAPEEGMAMGLMLDGSVGGTGGDDGGATLSYSEGFYFAWHEEDHLGVRLDVGIQGLFIESAPDMVVAPFLNAALLYPLDHSGDDYKSLGLQLHAAAPYQERADGERTFYGRFRLAIVFEHHVIDERVEIF